MRIILLGPTASGKTELALQVAEELKLPIISADSRQCYKRLDIGTAKPGSEELSRVTHYNISNLELNETDSVQAFAERVKQWEQKILKTRPHTFITGGSTLHLQCLIRPMDKMPAANAENIAALELEIETGGIEPLYNRLKKHDPEYAAAMDGMNRQRIIRALDVWMQTGQPFSSFHANKKFVRPENTLIFGLQRSRENLFARINQRVDIMVEQGLFEEVKSILDSEYSGNLRALNAVGYREIIDYFDSKTSREQAIEKIKTNTRRYAKRQLTWFRRWDFIEWMDAENNSTEQLKMHILDALS